ncbi:hypothetical protein GCM10007916_03660 [Psychromonas marina]|uniref:Flagellar biosynthesis protein FlgP n=1 Tax=Psychromonas marina TaxID=88364 RepID=A0ABQ6DVY9_9GAMM|nr:hypothetical protein [Psychromonas marina]GLS89299.1 hypothetical protein GCM10007916_03660 [Psychromonas marina]
MKSYLSALLLLSLLSACTYPIDTPEPESNILYTFHSVGAAPIEGQSGKTFELKMLNAIKASKIEAYKEMAEQIYGVLLTAENSVEGAYLGDDRIKMSVKGLVKGARVLKSYHEGDLYITELELKMESLPYLTNTQYSDHGTSVIKVQEGIYY